MVGVQYISNKCIPKFTSWWMMYPMNIGWCCGCLCNFFYKLDQNVAQSAGFLVVIPAHPYLSPQLDIGVHIFSRFILRFNDAVLSSGVGKFDSEQTKTICNLEWRK